MEFNKSSFPKFPINCNDFKSGSVRYDFATLINSCTVSLLFKTKLLISVWFLRRLKQLSMLKVYL